MPALITGTAAPMITLSDAHGRAMNLADQLQRGPVVLAFFKVSCPVCQYTFPFLERLHKAYPRAALYGISQNSAVDTERFCREFGVTFPVLLDNAKGYPASNAYGLTNVPSIFFIAPDATIEVSAVGWSRRDIEEIGTRLAAAQKHDPVPLFRGNEQVSDFRAG